MVMVFVANKGEPQRSENSPWTCLTNSPEGADI